MADHDRRSEPRVDVELGTVEVDGKRYALRNWSAHGFAAVGYTGGRLPGDVLEVAFTVSFAGVNRKYSGQAEILRTGGSNLEIAGKLLRMEDDWSGEELSQYFTQNWDEE